jgi:hypothetical protein
MHCNVRVERQIAERHYLRCSKVQEFKNEILQVLMGKASCPLCRKHVRSIKGHLLHKHGFDMKPDGSFVIRNSFTSLLNDSQ